MKTLVFRKFDNSVRVEVKVDIFAKNTQLLEPGFDTRFTAMDIATSDAAIILGIDIRNIEQNFRSLVALAESLPDFGLFVYDMTESNIPAQAQIVELRFNGSSGTANVTINGVNYLATFNTSLSITVDDFITAHTAALTAAGITMTDEGNTINFIAAVPGTPFRLTTANVSGNLNNFQMIVVAQMNQTGKGEVTLSPVIQ